MIAPVLAPHNVLTAGDWLALLGQFLLLSLMSVGGAISTSAEMHRYLVEQHHWISPAQFNQSIALAQASPGPNVLFVALMGWHVGMNAGSIGAAMLGVAVTMSAILIPSTTLTYLAARWGQRNRELRVVRAFKQGMAPVVIALLLSTSWLLASAGHGNALAWPAWVLAFISAMLLWRTGIHLLWVLALGAAAGALQLV